MILYYYLNGKQVDTAEAQLHVSDLAVLRGFGIFDYFLVRHRRPLFLQDYLDRFYTSADKLGLEIPFDRNSLAEQIITLVNANGQQDAGIRLVLTGGYAIDSYTPQQPNLIIMQHEYKAPPNWQYERGISLLSYGFQREFPEIKSINYLTGIRMQATLQAKQADYLLYHDQDIIRESDRSNFFAITPEGTLVTPHEKVLLGITRKQVMKLASEIMPVEEREIRMEELPKFKEAFLTSSTKGVMPVIQVDELTIGNGQPGEETNRLRELFEDLALMTSSAP